MASWAEADPFNKMYSGYPTFWLNEERPDHWMNVWSDKVVAYFERNYDLLCKEGYTTRSSFLYSRKSVAENFGVSKTFIAPILEGLVMQGYLRKERYMLTKSPKDQRWQWLYSLV